MAILGNTPYFYYGTSSLGMKDWKVGSFKRQGRTFAFIPKVPAYAYQLGVLIRRYVKSGELTYTNIFPNEKAKEIIRDLRNLSELYIFNEKLKAGKEKPMDYPHNEEMPPFPYQRIGTTLLIANPFYALFCEQGTGKTRMTIDALNYLYDKGIRKVLVATPNSVIYSWVSDIKKFCVVPYRVFPAVVAKRKAISQWLEADREKLNFLIIGYDFLWRLFPDLRTGKDIDHYKENYEKDYKSLINACKKAYKSRDYREKLKKKIIDKLLTENDRKVKAVLQDTLMALNLLDEVDVVIADESQRIKTNSAKRTKSFIRIAFNAKRKYLLSGTPITNSPIDIFSQTKFLQFFMIPTLTKFKLYFVDTANKGHYEIVRGIRKGKEEEFKRFINSFSFIVKKQDVLKDLPEKMFVEREIVLGEQASNAYKALEMEMAAEVRVAIELEEKAKSIDEENKEEKKKIQKELITTASHILTKIIRLSQLTSGFLVDDEDSKPYPIDNAKIEAVLELLEELGEKKVIIWGNFKYEIERLYKAIKKAGYKTAFITGDVKVKDRKKILADFQDGDLQVLIANPATLSTGVTLTATDVAVYYSLTYRLEDFLQSQDRIHRIGQKSKRVTYYILLSRLNPKVAKSETEQTRTIDRQIYKALRNKERIANNVVKFAKEYLESENESRVESNQ